MGFLIALVGLYMVSALLPLLTFHWIAAFGLGLAAYGLYFAGPVVVIVIIVCVGIELATRRR